MNEERHLHRSQGGAATSVMTGELVNVAGMSGIALGGYDPVAFFTDSKAVNGDPAISANYKGATYFFASQEHRSMFEDEPEKYVPAYGGYCAFGVAKGALFPVDINTWQIRDGKLYLNLNPAILELFNKDFDNYVKTAEKNWPSLEKKYAK